MRRLILLSAALLLPLAAWGDTLILKNGNRLNGNFVSGDSQSVQFAERNGTRRTFNAYEIQELRFGGENQGNPGAASYAAPATGDLNAAVDRLEGDLRMALDNSNLSEDQRRSLRDSRETLRHAVQVSQSGQMPDRPALRLAMDNIRSAMNDPSIRPESRDRVLGDLDQARSMFPGMNDNQFGRGRNY